MFQHIDVAFYSRMGLTKLLKSFCAFSFLVFFIMPAPFRQHSPGSIILLQSTKIILAVKAFVKTVAVDFFIRVIMLYSFFKRSYLCGIFFSFHNSIIHYKLILVCCNEQQMSKLYFFMTCSLCDPRGVLFKKGIYLFIGSYGSSLQEPVFYLI